MAANTNSAIILAIFAFYIVITVLLGLIGSAQLQANRNTPNTPEDPSLTSFLSQIAYFFFGIGFSISNIPAWANVILFLPLAITLAYIGISFLRGSS